MALKRFEYKLPIVVIVLSVQTHASKVHAENEDTTDEGGCVFIPVKNGEGIIMQVFALRA